MALNGLICADVPLSNYSLTHVSNLNYGGIRLTDAINLVIPKFR